MSDEEEDLPQDIKDLQRDIIIDLLSKTKRRLKRSVWNNLKLAFRYKHGRRLDPNIPEDKEKLEETRPMDYFMKNGIRQLHKNLQEYKFSGMLEDAKQFARRVGRPVGTGAKKFSSAVGPVITKYTEKLAGYNEDRLEQFGYNKDGRKFAEVTPPKPTSKASFVEKAISYNANRSKMSVANVIHDISDELFNKTSKAGEFLKKVPGELNKDLKKAAGELDRDFMAAFHYTKSRRLDSKNPEDRKVLEERMSMDYWIEKNATYGEQKWFNRNFSLMENGNPMPGKTRADVEAAYDKFIKKSAAYEALKKFKLGKIGKYGWSDLGRGLYDGIGKIGDGILYFPRRYLENERRENRKWEEIYCGFTPRMNDYMKTKRLEREALKNQAKAQAGTTPQFIPVGVGTSAPVVYMFNYQPQILAVDPSLFNRNQGQTN